MDSANEHVMSQKEPQWLGGTLPPVMTIDKFADLVGLTAATVKSQVNRGYYPTKKVGKRTLINIVLFVDELRSGI
ncbi:hypothetical protein [Oceanospirillum sediminis]|nr:hypothetical protein [Oceanospirillum sediminis]